MPRIIGQAEQQSAMRGIRSGLKELDAINQFLNNSSKDNRFIITMITPDSKKVSAFAFTPNKGELDLLVMNERDRIVTEITALAQNNRIEFDDRDLTILENRPAPLDEISVFSDTVENTTDIEEATYYEPNGI